MTKFKAKEKEVPGLLCRFQPIAYFCMGIESHIPDFLPLQIPPYFLFGFLLIANSLIKSSNNKVSVGSNISHFPSR